MNSNWRVLALTLAMSLLGSHVGAQPVELPIRPVDANGPTDRAVLLPPQVFDVPVKGPNHTRERYGEFSISGGVYLLQPVFNTNPAFTVVSTARANTRQVEFSHRLQAGPDVWLAYTPERGWGMRGRWFQFDHDSAASYAVRPGETIRGITSFAAGAAPVTGAVLADSNLAVNMFDAQFTRSFGTDRWTHLFGIGVRYTHMSQDYRANLTSPATQITLTSGHNFNGWGPSLSWETKRRFGDTGLAIYAQTHFAAVFGQGNESSLALNNNRRSEDDRGYTDVLPVGELEAGLEYQRDLGTAKIFVQTGFAGQIWWGGGNASNLESASFNSARDSNFGFVGLVVRAGVRY